MLTSPQIPPLLLPLGAAAHHHGLRDRTVLLVENRPSGVHKMLELSEIWADAEVVRATSAGALDFLETDDVDAAIVDFRRPDETSKRVVRRLQDRGIPFVVLTPEMLSRSAQFTVRPC